MKPSYRQLLDEHKLIEETANELLEDIADHGVGASGLAGKLHQLAVIVERHLEVEERVIRTFDEAGLKGPWIEAWAAGIATFEKLKGDWIVFLAKWDRAAIEGDRNGFARAAQAILARLRERVQEETRALYATALQHGAIELR